MKQNKYLHKKRQERLRKNFHSAILTKDAVRVHAISDLLGLKFTKQQIEDLFKAKHD